MKLFLKKSPVMKRLFMISVFALVSTVAFSQWSLGARFGGVSGASLKHYSTSSALELLAGINFDNKIDGFFVSPLFEKMASFDDSGNLNALIGPGLNFIFGDEFYFGLSGVIGVDWRIGRIGVQVDWMPSYIFVNESHFSFSNAAFTARWFFE